MDLIVSQAVALLVVASLVAIIARRLQLPYTVGLVLTGIALSLSGVTGGATLTHDLIFLVFLPPLLFEAALGIPWGEFRRDAVPVLALATFGVVISAAVVATGMVEFLGWPARSALIFGTLIAATDPVAVIALFKDIRIDGRARVMVESESLLNDGVAAVLFVLVLAWNGGETPSAIAASKDLFITAIGGIFVGLACGAGALALAGRIADHLIETVLTAVAAYGSFLLAEHLQVSGILASVSAGILMGKPDLLGASGARLFSCSIISPRGHEFLKAFWEFAAFVANSFIFLLIGLAVPAGKFLGVGSSSILVAIGLVLIGRAIAVYGICLPFSRTRWAVPPAAQHILWWGGLRGALGLALALTLPPTVAFHEEILVSTFGVVVFSVVVQGLSMPTLLRKLGEQSKAAK
jgi:CPA1 family monovalent cation:H+ antiporter